MEVEDLLRSVGNAGRFQYKLIYLFLLPVQLLQPWTHYMMLFFLNAPDHWCMVPGMELTEYNMEQWKNITIPLKNNTTIWESCLMFNVTPGEAQEGLTQQEMAERWGKIDCQYGWVYDQSNFYRTAVTEGDWVCEREAYEYYVLTIHAAGNAIGSLFYGQITDSIGRKKVLLITTFLNFLLRVINIFTVHHFWLFMVTTLLAGTVTYAYYIVSIIIVTELCGPELRTHLNGVAFFGWTIGLCSLPLLAWITSDYITLVLAGSAPVAVAMFYFFMIPETPRWLIIQGRFDEATETLKKIAVHNGRPPPHNLRSQVEEALRTELDREVYSIKTLFSYKKLRRNTLLLVWAAAVNSFVYNLVYQTIVIRSDNPFLEFFLLSIVEFPSIFLCWFLAERFGRRWINVAYFVLMLLTATIAAIVAYIHSDTYGPTEIDVPVVVLAMLAKFCINSTFLVLYLQDVELFPTCVRGIGSACVEDIQALSGIMVPITGMQGKFIPFVVTACLSAITTITSMFLPETLHRNLPETIEDSEEYAEGRNFWVWKTWDIEPETLRRVQGNPT